MLEVLLLGLPDKGMVVNPQTVEVLQHVTAHANLTSLNASRIVAALNPFRV
jgi:hypothetical protein